METLTITIKLHLAEKELPENSGDYLTVTPRGTILNVYFSKKHKEFNAFDHMEKPKEPYKVVFWAEIPDVFLWKNLAKYREE